MSLNASIIEQRVRKLVEDHREALGPGDDDKLRSKAFVLLTTSVMLDISLMEALPLVTDGGHDLAIDALHVGDIVEGEFLVTLVQGKYRRKPGGAFPANDIRKLIQTVGILFDPDLPAPHARLEIVAKVEEIRSLVRDGNLPTVRVVLCNNGERWSPDGDALIREARLPEEQVIWEHVDHDALVAMMQRPRQVDDELQLVGSAIVEEFDFCRVLLGKVSVTELARLFGIHGDRLLERNIRRHLGLRNNRVNSAIARTLRSRDKRSSFYFFNNGVTLTCSKFRRNALQGANYRAKLENLQVINGGQTCSTVSRTLEQLPDEDFSQTYVLVRIYELDDDQRELVHEITYATNSQNPVDLRDLRANDEIQARLELGLRDLGYTYLRKREQVGEGDETITPAEVAEAIMAVWRGKPHLARLQRSQFFGRLYSEIFRDDLTPAQVVLAVEIMRGVRRHEARYDEPPRFLPYAAQLIAMLMRLELEDWTHEPASTHALRRVELVRRHGELLYARAVQRVRILLALTGISEVSASLQRLAGAFRRGNLLERLREVTGEGPQGLVSSVGREVLEARLRTVASGELDGAAVQEMDALIGQMIIPDIIQALERLPLPPLASEPPPT